VLIISPSGNLYGSERVLLDYVTNTSLQFDLAVPSNSDLLEELKRVKFKSAILTYNVENVRSFYIKLIFSCLLGKYKKLYINEGGHIKYILLLARLFPAIQFAIHIRIIEDTAAERWQFVKGKLPNNIKIITISNYLSELIPFQNLIIPDPFIFNGHKISGVYDESQPFQIGIIGRVALSKGIGLLSYLMEELAKQQLTEKFKIHLFGEISEDLPEEIKVFLNNNNAIVLHGYVKNNSAIYDGLHAILHLSETEPLGRVFFEAVDQGLPFVGINAGGIGETSKKYDCTELVIEPDEKRPMAIKLVEKLTKYRNNYMRYIDLISRVKMEMSKHMSIADYCARLDNIINTGKPLN